MERLLTAELEQSDFGQLQGVSSRVAQQPNSSKIFHPDSNVAHMAGGESMFVRPNDVVGALIP